jgi:short-subunit dehydrogenase
MSDIQNKKYGQDASILITGASSGIGAALAEYLAQFGGKIALVARRHDRLETVAQKVRAQGGYPLVVPTDVTDHAAVSEAHRQIVAAQGPITVAFLNAGAGDLIKLHRFEAKSIRRIFEVNVFGVLYWMEAVLPAMLEQHYGIIAATSSLASYRALAHQAGAYSSSKAALSTLLDGYRGEARTKGLQITLIEPGFIRSEMTAKNTFTMPLMLETMEAVRIIAEEVAAGKAFVRFPWPMALAARLIEMMPSPLFDRLGQLMQKRITE